jgi:nitrate reductase gamma subunit
MEITTRSLWTLVHGMGFGALYLLACSGAIVLLYLRFSNNAQTHASPVSDRFLGIYLAAMAALAWLTVLSGTYIIYP